MVFRYAAKRRNTADAIASASAWFAPDPIWGGIVPLAEALEWQQKLQALRPVLPKHAPVEETELAGRLVRHTGKLKTIIDLIRIVCANAESELAAHLAPHMRRPREAKNLIANLFAAPVLVLAAPRRDGASRLWQADLGYAREANCQGSSASPRSAASMAATMYAVGSMSCSLSVSTIV